MISDETTRTGRIFQALLDLNIVYKSKYYDVMYLEHALYSNVLETYTQNIRSSMSKMDQAKYWLYCRSHGIFLGSKRRGIPYLSSMQQVRGHFLWSRDSFEWEFAELYYEISKGRESTEDLMK